MVSKSSLPLRLPVTVEGAVLVPSSSGMLPLIFGTAQPASSSFTVKSPSVRLVRVNSPRKFVVTSCSPSVNTSVHTRSMPEALPLRLFTPPSTWPSLYSRPKLYSVPHFGGSVSSQTRLVVPEMLLDV